MSIRTDIHRPSQIIVEDYDFVCFEYLPVDGLGAVEAILRERAAFEAFKARTGATRSTHEHAGNCAVCGNVFAIYTLIFHHRPTNTYLSVGSDCSAKIDAGRNEAGFTRFTAAIRDAREAQAGKRKAEITLNDLGLQAAWQEYTTPSDAAFTGDRYIVRDMVTKLVRYGSLSEKQINFLRVLLDRIANRSKVEAQRAAEAAAAPAWQAGRQVVTGEIVSARWGEPFARYSAAPLKALIKLADGRKLWTTLPTVFYDTQTDCATWARGKSITINVTVEPSKDDHSFAFGKRPTLQSPVPPTEEK